MWISLVDFPAVSMPVVHSLKVLTHLWYFVATAHFIGLILSPCCLIGFLILHTCQVGGLSHLCTEFESNYRFMHIDHFWELLFQFETVLNMSRILLEQDLAPFSLGLFCSAFDRILSLHEE
jgi:hypothetical protein